MEAPRLGIDKHSTNLCWHSSLPFRLLCKLAALRSAMLQAGQGSLSNLTLKLGSSYEFALKWSWSSAARRRSDSKARPGTPPSTRLAALCRKHIPQKRASELTTRAADVAWISTRFSRAKSDACPRSLQTSAAVCLRQALKKQVVTRDSKESNVDEPSCNPSACIELGLSEGDKKSIRAGPRGRSRGA